MIKHKWKEDKCIHCGIRRERKETRVFVRTVSYLSRSGIFEDKNIYEERMRYHYYDLDGQGFGVDRPDCIKIGN
jgi:hypothetical protein